MRWNPSLPHRRGRRADRLDDLASALDGGLGVDAALAAADVHAPGSAGSLSARLAAAFEDLRPVDIAVLDAAETAGALPGALRDLAAADRTAAANARDLAARIAYPLVVVTMAVLVTLWLAFLGVAPVPGAFLGAWCGVLAVAIATIGWTQRAARRDPGFDVVARVPWFGELAADAAHVPYLEAMRRLHGAGVRIDVAHELATATCPLASQRARLVAAGTSLRAGASYADAMANAHALDEASRRTLANAERVGGLEVAFAEIARRQRVSLELRGRRVARTIGAVAYGFAVVLVAVVVLSFYSGMLARTGAMGR